MPETTTYTPPETVSISGKTALEILAVLNAYTEVVADFRNDVDATNDLHNLQEDAFDALARALPDPSEGMENPDWLDVMWARSAEIEKGIREFIGDHDTLRIASLGRAVLALGQEVVGVFWDDEKNRWVTPRKYFADVETTNA